MSLMNFIDGEGNAPIESPDTWCLTGCPLLETEIGCEEI